VKRSENLK